MSEYQWHKDEVEKIKLWCNAIQNSLTSIDEYIDRKKDEIRRLGSLERENNHLIRQILEMTKPSYLEKIGKEYISSIEEK